MGFDLCCAVLEFWVVCYRCGFVRILGGGVLVFGWALVLFVGCRNIGLRARLGSKCYGCGGWWFWAWVLGGYLHACGGWHLQILVVFWLFGGFKDGVVFFYLDAVWVCAVCVCLLLYGLVWMFWWLLVVVSRDELH